MLCTIPLVDRWNISVSEHFNLLSWLPAHLLNFSKQFFPFIGMVLTSLWFPLGRRINGLWFMLGMEVWCDMRSCRTRIGNLWQEPVWSWQPEHSCFLFCTLWLLHGINHGYCTGGHWTHGYMNIFELHQALCERGYWGNQAVLSGYSMSLRVQQGRDVVPFSLSHRRKEAISNPTKDDWERGSKV